MSAEKSESRLDFFIASALATFNKQLTGNRKRMFSSSNLLSARNFIIQRYLPPLNGEKSAMVLRCCWKKSAGFKIYKIQSLVPIDGNRMFESEGTARTLSMKTVDLDITELNLLNFRALTAAYKKIQEYSPEHLKQTLE